MDSNSIRINLLPKKEVNKKTKIIFVAISVIAMTIAMSTVGMFFIDSRIASACHGAVTVIKKTSVSDTQSFNFTSVFNAATSSFSLADSESKQLDFAIEGEYVITENKIDGWELTDISCQTNFAINKDLANRKVTIYVNDNGSATCTFTNTKKTSVCGNGSVETGEECDDGNTADGDGCSATCTTEEGICEFDLDVVMVMDRSGSMGFDVPTRFSQSQIAANSFLSELKSVDQSGLVSFASTVTLDKTLSNNHSQTQLAVNTLFPYGSTNIGGAINIANGELTSSRANPDAAQIMILLTDGKANLPNGLGYGEYPGDVAYAVAKANESAAAKIKIFTVGLGSDINAVMLEQIASTTGGKYYFAPTAQDLDEIFALIRPAICEEEPACGDGKLDTGEQCDDGNTVDGDGCSSTCATETPQPKCGNGIVETGEQCDDGNKFDGDGCNFSCQLEPLKIKTYKVVCNTEADLPNWGLNGEPTKPNKITANTASDYVGLSNGKCRLVAGWDFQWGFDGVAAKQSGDFVGPAGTGWNSFSSQTSDNGATPAVVTIGDLQGKSKLWVRENLKDGYIPFSSPDGDLQASTSAEIYCHEDILNFDNYDRIDDAKLGETYYCVAFNVLKPVLPACGDGNLDSSEECDDGNNNNGDGCSATCTVEHSGPVCGNGTVEAGEQCDDGNTNNNDGCNSRCQTEIGSLTICKFNDLNKNSAYDIGTDTPLVWNMKVTYPNGSTTTVQTASTTGCYEMSQLPYGVYQVEEELLAGWVKSYPNDNPTTATIASSSENQNVTFLNYEQPVTPRYGSIRVCKLIDGDGLASTTEDQYAATSSVWNFSLISSTGTTTKATTIGNNCTLFSELSAGVYQVREVEQKGWQLVDPIVNNVEVNLSAEENKVLTFVNSVVVVPKSSISGYKYNDANNNGVIDSGEQKMSGWIMQLIGCPYSPLGTSTIQFLPNSRWNTVSTGTEPIAGQCTVIATTTTDSTGYYEFTGLNAGDYGVSEVMVASGWSQTYPANNSFYYFNLPASSVRTNINFANYKPGEVVNPYCGDGKVDSGEQCDDGNNRNGDGCSSTCRTEGGGGGGGGSIETFNIYDTTAKEENCDVIITWRTNYSASSRIYYDTEPHSTSTMPNADYVYATIEDVSKVTGHNVKISGLKPNTTYYFRAYSESSSAKYGQEIVYKTSGQCTPTVKGEEGKPVLVITKAVNAEFANPGQKDVEYLITVANKGNLTAYSVKLKDLLPKGLTYVDLSGDNRSWDLGDMNPGDSKAIIYKVNVDTDARAMVYTNTAEASASNADSVKATEDLEVRTIKVLAVTGFSLAEFIIMLSTLTGLVGLSIFLRRKIALNED